jgi:hypothetical protein
MCIGVFFPGGKAQGHEADHSPPIIAEVKKTWLIYYTLIAMTHHKSCPQNICLRDNLKIKKRNHPVYYLRKTLSVHAV